MSESLGLGKIITTKQHRDAIHIAVAPVTAGERLHPGERVGFNDPCTTLVLAVPDGDAIGIVDPFLKDAVEKGQEFWMYLFPGSITSLRHEWTHPAFPLPDAPRAISGDKAESEKWLRDFVARSDCPDYDFLVEVASNGKALYDNEWGDTVRGHVEGDYIFFGNTDAHGEIPPEFWYHVEVVTGKKLPFDDRPSYFSCSC